MTLQPVVGIVGGAGAYGRWLAEFLRTRMGLEVLGTTQPIRRRFLKEHCCRACRC